VIPNAIFITSVLFLAGIMFLMQELNFLAPYREVIMNRYGKEILAFASALFVNVTAFVYLLSRKFALKGTGQKLAHMEKGLRGGAPISVELSERLAKQ